MENERRKGNEQKIDELIVIVNRIETNQKLTHQQHKEVTMPRIENVEDCLYGRGKLLDEHAVYTSKLDLYESFGKKLGLILILSIGQFIIFAGGLSVLYFQVNHLWKVVFK